MNSLSHSTVDNEPLFIIRTDATPLNDIHMSRHAWQKPPDLLKESFHEDLLKTLTLVADKRHMSSMNTERYGLNLSATQST